MSGTILNGLFSPEDLFEQEVVEGAEIKQAKVNRGFSSQFSASCSK